MKGWCDLPKATLLYIAHGERLHEWVETVADGERPRVGVSSDQMSLLEDPR